MPWNFLQHQTACQIWTSYLNSLRR